MFKIGQPPPPPYPPPNKIQNLYSFPENNSPMTNIFKENVQELRTPGLRKPGPPKPIRISGASRKNIFEALSSSDNNYMKVNADKSQAKNYDDYPNYPPPPPPPSDIYIPQRIPILGLKKFKDDKLRVIPYAEINKKDIRDYIKKAVFDDNGKLLGDFYLQRDSEGNYHPQYFNGNRFYNLLSNNFNFYKKQIYGDFFSAIEYQRNTIHTIFEPTNTEEEPLTELAPIEGGKRRRKTKRRKTNRRKTKRRR